MKALAISACALLSLFVLAGCGAPPTKEPPKDAEGRYVVEMVAGNKFAPATATVPQGATVVWKNTVATPHDVNAKDGSFSSGAIGGMQEGDEFPYKFDQTGSFPYECQVHSGMTGTITVE